MTQAAPTPSAALARRKEIALRVLQLILALFFAGASAAPKLTAHSSAVETFQEIGFGSWFMYVIGALELAGAIALVVPWLAALAALAFIGLMVGAFITQLTVFDGEYAVTPVLFGIPLAIIAWARRGTLAEPFVRLRGALRPGTAGE